MLHDVGVELTSTDVSAQAISFPLKLQGNRQYYLCPANLSEAKCHKNIAWHRTELVKNMAQDLGDNGPGWAGLESPLTGPSTIASQLSQLWKVHHCCLYFVKGVFGRWEER